MYLYSIVHLREIGVKYSRTFTSSPYVLKSRYLTVMAGFYRASPVNMVFFAALRFNRQFPHDSGVKKGNNLVF